MVFLFFKGGRGGGGGGKKRDRVGVSGTCTMYITDREKRPGLPAPPLPPFSLGVHSVVSH